MPTDSDRDAQLKIEMNVHHGIVKSVDYTDNGSEHGAGDKIRSLLVGRKLQDVGDWYRFLRGHQGSERLAKHLARVLPIPDAPKS